MADTETTRVAHHERLERVRAILHQRLVLCGRNLAYTVGHILVTVMFVISMSAFIILEPTLTVSGPYGLTLDHFHNPVAPYRIVQVNTI